MRPYLNGEITARDDDNGHKDDEEGKGSDDWLSPQVVPLKLVVDLNRKVNIQIVIAYSNGLRVSIDEVLFFQNDHSSSSSVQVGFVRLVWTSVD